MKMYHLATKDVSCGNETDSEDSDSETTGGFSAHSVHNSDTEQTDFNYDESVVGDLDPVDIQNQLSQLPGERRNCFFLMRLSMK